MCREMQSIVSLVPVIERHIKANNGDARLLLQVRHLHCDSPWRCPARLLGSLSLQPWPCPFTV